MKLRNTKRFLAVALLAMVSSTAFAQGAPLSSEPEASDVASDITGDQATATSRNTSSQARGALNVALGADVSGVMTQTGLAAGDSSSGAGAWSSVSASRFSNDVVGAYAGTLSTISVGYDQLITDSMVVGLSFELSDNNTDYAGNGSLNGTSATIVGYAGQAFDNGLIIDGFVGFGVSDYDNDTAALGDGSFDTEKWMIGLNASKSMMSGKNTMFTLTGGIFHVSESKDGYTLIDAAAALTPVSGVTSDLTKASLELEIASQIGNARPYAILGLDHDFNNTDAPSGTDDTGATLGGGFRYVEGDLNFGMSLISEFGRDDESNTTLAADFRFAL